MRDETTALCCACTRKGLPLVPGSICIVVAHVNERGEPCLDGKGAADGDCTTWAIQDRADLEFRHTTDWLHPVSRVTEWQYRNLLDLCCD